MVVAKHLWGRVSRKFKFKRCTKGRIKGLEYSAKRTNIVYGNYAVKIFKAQRITSKQLNAARASITRKRLFNKRYDQIWVRGMFNIPVSRKPNEIRMGKGKGAVNDWVLRIKPGTVLLEIKSIRMPPARAWKIYQLLTNSLGLPGKLIENVTGKLGSFEIKSTIK